MPSKKQSSARAAPKISGATALTSSAATTKQLSKSAIIKHSFAPSPFQLSLFASVVQGYDGQVLRLHDTLTGKVRSQHSLEAGKVSCLSWGYFGAGGGGDSRPSKKRKTQDGAAAESRHDLGDAVIAIGTATSPDIELFSPAKGKVVTVLSGAHSQGIKDFKFTSHGTAHRAWSLGGDGKLVEWSTIDGTAVRSLQLPSQSSGSNTIFPLEPTILCAQSTIWGVDSRQPSDAEALSGFTSNVHSLAARVGSSSSSSGGSQIEGVLAAAEATREIILFDYGTQKIRGQMLAANSVDSFALEQTTQQPPSALAAVTDGGEVEMFERPFDFGEADGKQSNSAKAVRKSAIRKAKASLCISRPGAPSDRVPIVNAEFDGNDLIIAWIEGGSEPCFERVNWRESSGSWTVAGETVLEKAKSQYLVANAKMNGVELARTQVDDSQTVVSRGGEAGRGDGMDVDAPEVIDISSGEEEDSSDDGHEQEEVQGSEQQLLTNGALDDDDMSEASDAGEEGEEGPSFGELLRAKAPEPVDVASAFPAKAQTTLVPQGIKAVGLPSGMSLGTVLAQSLRTNDRELLETCFHVQDLQVVRATIERLDAALAASLLVRLAERLHNRPGRAGSLMVWIQWTLVAHGGHLAGQAHVVSQLKKLHSVVKERAQALQPLLLLKGKLDMLDAQMQLRKSMIERSRLLQAAQEEDEEEAIYVEGQDEVDSDSEEETRVRASGALAADGDGDIEFDSDSEDGMPTTMAVDDDDLDVDDVNDESSGDENGLVVDEAEETEDDDGDDDDDDDDGDREIDYDDVDSADEDEDSEHDGPVEAFQGKTKVNGIVKRR